VTPPPSRRPRPKDRLEYAALAAGLAALRLPGRRLGLKLGESLGAFSARVVPVRRDVALDNLRQALPELDPEARVAVYRAMCRNLGRVLADFARLTVLDAESVRGLVGFGDLSALEAHAGGALLLTAHYGNWEALGAGLAARGFPLTVLGARQRNPLVEDLFSRYRSRFGMEAVSVSQGLRPVVSALKRGRLVATLADQDGGREGFFLPFLGRQASVQAGVFRLAVRAEVPVFTGFCFRDGDRWRAEAQEPLVPRPAATPTAQDAEARRLAAAYTARVEDYVRRRPEHWFWVHRRWHTRPQRPPAGGR